AHERGTTAVVVTHDPRAAHFADRAVRIRDGRVSEESRNGSEQLVVARGGWVRLPEEMLQSARIGDRVEARVRGGAIVVTASPTTAASRPELAAHRTSVPGGGSVLELRDVGKRYGERAVLYGFTASVERGRLTVVTGPSGSGKTTLLDIAIGLELPDAGTVLLGDDDLTLLDRAGRAAARRDHVGYVAQQPVLTGFLSARENVELGLRLRERDGDALEALDAVGLAERAEQRVDRLSHGERLRVAIARALASRPDVVVADEPTSRLDERNARVVTSLLAQVARERNTAVLVASHDPAVIEQADALIAL
ncbi:MAG TPA: ATP-binding cassette domain-containing protein, partial [Gaiellaceae bacterium]|nr:ATP-binding cassette domain-containing protein [Gaiellaceae bacterium]